jgi:hypothetical protein
MRFPCVSPPLANTPAPAQRPMQCYTKTISTAWFTAMIQQHTTIQPLTDEQKTLVESIKTTPPYFIIYLIVGTSAVLFFSTLFLFGYHKGRIGDNFYLLLHLLHLFVEGFLFFIIVSRILTIQKQAPKLCHCHNTAVCGALTGLLFIVPKSNRQIYIDALIPLLYSVNTKDAETSFTKNQRKQLRAIATKPYWRKQEPDLVAAALVGLVALNDYESKQTLENLAQRKWSKSEAWVGNAAKMCLAEWGKR